MEIMNFQSANFTEAYNIQCAAMASAQFKVGLHPTLCKIPIKGKTTKHSHHEPEIFFIIKGSGSLSIGEEIREIKAGDLITITPLAEHELTNTDEDELHFLSVYAEDTPTVPLPESILITTAPPTPNGPLHLGHISGPYLAADVLGRYLRLEKKTVKTLSGTDDHQNYVLERAITMGLDPDEFHRQMRSRIKDGLSGFSIEYDEFIEPKTDLLYKERVINFYKRAKESKIIDTKIVNFPYCVECDLYLVDALIEGQCPQCGESSRGGCENCGLVYPPYRLRKKKCGRCLRPASERASEVQTFSLSTYLHLIKEELAELTLSPKLRSLILSVQKTDDAEILLTYPGNTFGTIRIPAKDENIHVWFEMAAHYENFFINSLPWVHSFGFDNAYYYLLFMPALIKAMNSNSRLPHAVLTNEFLNLEGKKFSTSRGHAIWADEFQGNSDHLRLYLCIHRPDDQTSDFQMIKFEKFSENLKEQLLQLNQRARQLLTLSGMAKQVNIDLCERLQQELGHVLNPRHFNSRQAANLLLIFLDRLLKIKEDVGSEKIMMLSWAKWISPFMPRESQILYLNLEGNNE